MPVYCKIKDYLTAKHKKLAELLENTCVASLLMPNKFRRGITFVIPSAETIKELEALVDSDDVHKFNTACDILKAHIFPVYFKSADAWAEQPVQNVLRNHQEVTVKGGNVVFKDGGAVIKLDEGFKGKLSAGNESYLAVYEITKGKLTLGEPAEVDENGKPVAPRKKKVGSSEASKNKRCKYLDEILRVKFTLDDFVIGYNQKNVCAVECEKLKKIAIAKDADRFYKLVFPFLKMLADYDLACMVLIGALLDEPIITDDVIDEWYNTRSTITIDVEEHCKMVVAEAEKRGIIPAGDISCDLDYIKDEILALSNSAAEYIENIKGVYNRVLASNRLENIINVFPTEFLEFVKEKPMCKLYLDCHAFHILCEMRTFAKMRDKPLPADIENYVSKLFHVESMDKGYEERIRESLMNNTIPELVKRDRMKAVIRFLQSKCFLVQVYCE